MAGPRMWSAGSFQPFPISAACNWWDASLNRVAAAYRDPENGECATAWAHAGVSVVWAEHAVQRMFERQIRIDQVVDSFIRTQHTQYRAHAWPWFHWVHTGINGVKVYVNFEGESPIDPNIFVYKISTVVDEGENLNT